MLKYDVLCVFKHLNPYENRIILCPRKQKSKIRMLKAQKKKAEVRNRKDEKASKDKVPQQEKSTKNSEEECSPSICSPNLKSKIYNYIGSFGQAPAFLQDNQFIKHGYRINFDTPKKIFKRFFVFSFKFS